MAAVETLSFIDPQKTLNTWASDDPPTVKEKIEFAKGVIKELANPEVNYAENVKQSAVAASQADDAFYRVTQAFNDMVKKYGKQFPELSNFYAEWQGYYKRWVDGLKLSKTVSSAYNAKLDTFDNFYLNKVEKIVTDADRKAAIKELEFFTKLKFEEAANMSNDFKNLRRDIEGFAGTKDTVGTFEKWINDKKQYLEGEIKRLSGVVNDLKKQIAWWDEEIHRRTVATIACGASVNLIGLIVAGSLLADGIKKRNDLLSDLKTNESNLKARMDDKQALVNIQKDFNTLKPDFLLICEKLNYFAGLFAKLQDEATQFLEHLKLENPDEMSKELFKFEIEAARKICTPLRNGLTLYSTTVKIPDHPPL